MKKRLLPCPFCGENVEIEKNYTTLEITCCCTMSIQKSDYLSIEQRETWDSVLYKYTEEIENFVFDAMVTEWNTRK